MLNLKDIVVHYGGIEALQDVSIVAEKGSITTLIGSNGAGKSTCLRSISGLVPLTSGEIWFEENRIDGMLPEKIVKLGIAHVPEGKRLFPKMSVLDNLLTGAHLRTDKEEIDKDLEKAIEYFPILGEKLRKPANTLSGGQQQMLAFGRALLSNPRIFLFDEPSLGLAPIIVHEIGERIKQLADEGYTIILVEQNAKLALELASTAYVLETGKVAMEGDADQLKNNDYVKKVYLGI
ncbi:MAG: ABC transporter ATP-binding protein [Deltaproteobacteria bacterium]|jgi:branched-chain amino acid transport system ATP-binding protein|nr:ABC transporter ATP-binding protein [Deltaproteobacteria bacterium]